MYGNASLNFFPDRQAIDMPFALSFCFCPLKLTINRKFPKRAENKKESFENSLAGCESYEFLTRKSQICPLCRTVAACESEISEFKGFMPSQLQMIEETMFKWFFARMRTSDLTLSAPADNFCFDSAKFTIAEKFRKIKNLWQQEF